MSQGRRNNKRSREKLDKQAQKMAPWLFAARKEDDPRSIYQIARKSGVPYPTAYKIMDLLIKRELVSTVPGDTRDAILCKLTGKGVLYFFAHNAISNDLKALYEALEETYPKDQNLLRALFYPPEMIAGDKPLFSSSLLKIPFEAAFKGVAVTSLESEFGWENLLQTMTVLGSLMYLLPGIDRLKENVRSWLNEVRSRKPSRQRINQMKEIGDWCKELRMPLAPYVKWDRGLSEIADMVASSISQLH